MKKQFISRLSFTRAELMGRVALDFAGINIGGFVKPSEREAYNNMLQQFGFFGGSNNANTFYPEIAGASDVIPKPEDFVDAPFRLISATIVGAGSWKATDFTNLAVLRGSVDKLNRKPVYYDHDTDLLNWVGIVKSPKWTESFTNKDGIVVPAGIDGIISIDAKSNPKIARGVLLGSVFSNSVTVQFSWEMSHPFENEDDFNYRVGSIGSDGKMIRRIVTSISDYHESSLVWLGADPFAKLIDAEGNLVNIDTTAVAYDKAVEAERTTYTSNKKFHLNFAVDKNVIHLSRSTFETRLTNNDMKPEVLAMLISLLGLSKDTKAEDIKTEMLAKLQMKPDTPVVAITPEQQAQVDAFGKLKNIELVEGDAVTKFDGKAEGFGVTADSHVVVKRDTFTKLQTDAGKVTALESEKTSLTRERDALAPDAKLGKEYVAMQRAEGIRLYKLAVGADKADEAVVGLFQKATPEELKGLLAQYTKTTTAKFSGKCKACGSDEFEFRSTVGGTPAGGEVEEVEASSFDTIYSKHNKSSMDITTRKK